MLIKQCLCRIFKEVKRTIMADEQKQETVENTEAKENNEQVVETAEEVAESNEAASFQSQLEEKDKLIQEQMDRVKRLQADFDNFRRRTRQEKEELSAIVSQNLIKELLPLLDNFERALVADVTNESSALRDGVEMIYKQFFATLEKNGLEAIDAVGQKFDPNFHEAIMRAADETQEDDTVVEELQRGYSVRGRVIRPSMVKVVSN